MQQYYPRNVDSDPVRMSMKSQDLLPKKNIFSMMKNNNNKPTFNQFNNSNTKQPDLYRKIYLVRIIIEMMASVKK